MIKYTVAVKSEANNRLMEVHTFEQYETFSHSIQRQVEVKGHLQINVPLNE